MKKPRLTLKNLVVAATGTGKTVVAALDYARVRKEMGMATLLFVAHTEEVLEQSLARYRAAIQDGHFGEMLVGGRRPRDGTRVVASIQSLHKERLKELRPDAYDVVAIDEFHHAAADLAPTFDSGLPSPRVCEVAQIVMPQQEPFGTHLLKFQSQRELIAADNGGRVAPT